MSGQHACAWASDKGRELKLSCPERVTLWQLAERAATKGKCWPSLTQLMADTGLARGTLVAVVKALASFGLIRIEKQGQKHVYHMLNRFKSGPANRAEPVQNKTGERFKSEPATGSKTASDRFKNTPPTGSKLNPNLKRTLKEPEKGAQETRAEPEKQDLNFSEKKEGGTPPPDTFNDYLDNPTAGSAVPLAIQEPETITEDTPPQTEADRARMAAQLGALAQELGQAKRHFAIPRGPRFTANEHRDIAAAMASRPSHATVKPEILAAMYRAQGVVRGVGQVAAP